jgi:hypothetical protein
MLVGSTPHALAVDDATGGQCAFAGQGVREAGERAKLYLVRLLRLLAARS